MQRADPEHQRVRFTGSRWKLAGLLLRGYALMVPSLGLNRFWLTTRKRHFYWGNTEIGGDALEYSGDARQLLLGFLMALAIFLPLYALFFYLSTQSSQTALIGYGAVAVLVWFLHGYAIYRARDFRLSRTLWRGIRFDQAGSALVYGLRRFFWSLLNLATLGLVYPFMAANLWSYRYNHSWYGTRRFAFAGSWRQLVLPYYLCWLGMVVLLVVGFFIAGLGGIFERPFEGSAEVYFQLFLVAAGGFTIVTLYRAIEMSRLFSAVRLGEAALSVRLSVFRLLGQYVLFALALVAAYLLLALGGFLVLNLVAPEAFIGGGFDLDVLMRIMQSSTLTLLAIVTGYLLLFGAFTFTTELFLGYGFWNLVARSALMNDLATLSDVLARPEDKALAGEGLADALNVGGY